MDYTIIGSGVNLASRLEGAATPGEILISHETYALVKDEILCESAGMIEVKGIAHPIETYRVVDLYANLERERAVIREDSPNFKLEIDFDRLSAEEQGRAAGVLRRALNELDHSSGESSRRAI